jgi:alkylation response protein AidB-like acyl-CoA dehydrogenase
MGYLELDVTLSKEALAMRDTAQKFAMEVMRPAGIELDKMSDPEDVIAKGSALWDVYRQYRELGFHKMILPKSLGGMLGDLPTMALNLVNETLGYGDAGLAISLGAAGFPFYMAAILPDPEIQKLARQFAEDTEVNLLGCWAITEPDHGSDWILSVGKQGSEPRIFPSVRAELKGDEYIINGRKSAWVSNGTIATHAVLHVGLDKEKGMHGSGLALCPLNLPGISRGKPLDKLGQRPLNQGEIIFEDARLPKKYMAVSDSRMIPMIARMILTAANTAMSTCFAGLAQAAFDEALRYAKERIQGGVPIMEHRNIKLKLFDMFKMVESARTFSRAVSQYNRARMPVGSMKHAIAAKILSTETAFNVTSEALTIFGGYGVAKEYPVEKMFRDARASMIEDGVNETLAIGGSEDL